MTLTTLPVPSSSSDGGGDPTRPGHRRSGFGALTALVGSLGAAVVVDPAPGMRRPDTACCVVVTAPVDPVAFSAFLASGAASAGAVDAPMVLAVAPVAAATVAAALAHRGSAGRAAGMPVPVAGPTVTADDPADPLVATTRLAAHHDDLIVTVDDHVTVRGGEPVLGATTTSSDGGGPVVLAARQGPVVVVGGCRLLHDELLGGSGNAEFVERLLVGARPSPHAPAAVVAAFRPRAAGPHTTARPEPHAEPRSLTAAGHPDEWRPFLDVVPDHLVVGDELAAEAGRRSRLLPAALYEALVDLADTAPTAGALLVRGLPVGDVPPTPLEPGAVPKDRTSETVLLAVARVLGRPVGYRPEHGGRVVQDLSPTPDAVGRQVSTSSGGTLLFHTETAFHPHKPRYLLLLCLRGDPDGVARTTLAGIRELVDRLPIGVRRTLHEPRFATAADESFVGGRPTRRGRPVPVLTGTWDEPWLTFDADLMVGADPEADVALGALRRLVDDCHTGVVLRAGDLLVVDNWAAVHGRSPFTARFDGTDRWLQRTFVVSDLAPSTGARDGRVITTRFAR